MGPGWGCGGQVDRGTAMCPPAKVPSSLLGCVRTSLAGQGRGGLLFCPEPGRHPQCYVRCWGPQYRGDGDLWGWVHWGTTRNIKWLDHLAWGERLRAGTCPACSRECSGGSYQSEWIPDGEELRWWNQALLSGSQWQVTGQSAQMATQQTPFKKKKLYCEGDWTLGQDSQRDCRVSILGNTQNPTDAVLSYLLWLTWPWRGGWMTQSSEVPSSLIALWLWDYCPWKAVNK